MRLTVKDIINREVENKENHEVMPTGFTKIDDILDGGIFSKEIVVLGAHTGTGKSQIAGQIMLNIASKGFKSAYFSLEISAEMIISRMVGIKTNIKPTIIRFGELNQYDNEKKEKVLLELIGKGDLLSFYDDCYEIRQIISEIKANNYEFVVVDFIQNIIGDSDEYSKLSEAVIRLQKAAKEIGCAILILSQLSNTAAKDGSKSKTLEYKGSGSIAMVADLGLFLEKPDDSPDMTETILTIKKNRRGFSGASIRLGFTIPGGMIYEK